MIPVTKVHVPTAAEQLVLSVLRSGHLAQGPMVERLEAEFAAFCGVRHAIAVSNGTVALQLAAAALGIGPGDEVITTPFTFVATANALIATGARVRFVDIDPATFCLDPDQVANAIRPATSAIAPVHLYGLPADMAPLLDLADRHGLAVLEDVAQAHGAAINGRKVGSFGTGSFSFYATKNMTTGEGGIVTTDDDGVADRLRLLRNQGMRGRYEYEVIGTNARMTDLQAAVGVAELGELEHRTDQRIRNAAVLTEGLQDAPGITTPITPDGLRHVFHQYTIRVGPDTAVDRDQLVCLLAERGVGSGVYYPKVIHGYECFSEHPLIGPPGQPEAERATTEVLSLPVHPFLSEQDLDGIIDAVHAACTPAR